MRDDDRTIRARRLTEFRRSRRVFSDCEPFAIYARLNGRTPREQLAHDVAERGGTAGAFEAFREWHKRNAARFRQAHPEHTRREGTRLMMRSKPWEAWLAEHAEK